MFSTHLAEMDLVEDDLVGVADTPEPGDKGQGRYDAEDDPMRSVRPGAARLGLDPGNRAVGAMARSSLWRRGRRLSPGHAALTQAALGSYPSRHGVKKTECAPRTSRLSMSAEGLADARGMVEDGIELDNEVAARAYFA